MNLLLLNTSYILPVFLKFYVEYPFLIVCLKFQSHVWKNFEVSHFPFWQGSIAMKNVWPEVIFDVHVSDFIVVVNPAVDWKLKCADLKSSIHAHKSLIFVITLKEILDIQ